MKRYQVTHRTVYDYDDVVNSSYGRCYLTPRDSDGQRVQGSAVHIDPEPADGSTRIDGVGNIQTYFHVRSAHRRLEVVATSQVEVGALDAELLESPAALAGWEEACPTGSGMARAVEYVLDLQPPEIGQVVNEYAAQIFTPGRPLVDAVRELTTRIYTDFVYKSGSTTISTRVEEVMARREGVCQDFARVAVACLRSRGLAARYVSGYLSTDPPPGRERMVGADATHAWAAVWLPGDRWLGLDPTNDQLVGDRHVTVAWGRDYDDVAPLRGVIYTDSRESTITVSVDVAPID